MTVMDDLNVFEVLGADGGAAAVDDDGRVVITNLYNHTLPMIRYQLGDRVIRGAPSATGFSTITAIQPGKASEQLPVLLDGGGADVISAAALTSFYAPGLERAQFVRGADGIRIEYVGRRDAHAGIAREFERLLRLKGASRTRFDVLWVLAISPDPITGKVNLVRLEATAVAPAVFTPAPVGETVRDAPATAGDRAGGAAVASVEARVVEGSIAACFEALVGRDPDRAAVRMPGQVISYASLNRDANRLAHEILARDPGGQGPVALVVAPGVGAITAMLAVLKAGRFYVLIDAEQPAPWISGILEDARPSLVVADRMGIAVLERASVEPGRCRPMDALAEGRPARNPTAPVSPDALAYIMYTSGSTGRPKGAMHVHRDVLQQTFTYADALGLGARDCLTLLHSHAFSASRLDIFPALLSGAALAPLSPLAAGFRRMAEELVE